MKENEGQELADVTPRTLRAAEQGSDGVTSGLQPCPLCKCKVFKERFEYFSARTDGILGFSYRCPKCRTQFAVSGKSEVEAMKRWNTRAESDTSGYVRGLETAVKAVDNMRVRNEASGDPLNNTIRADEDFLVAASLRALISQSTQVTASFASEAQPLEPVVNRSLYSLESEKGKT